MVSDILRTKDNKTEKISKEEEIEYYDNILKKIEEGITSDNYYISALDKGKNDFLETEKITITLATLENQRININNNKSSIDLGKCEILLRNYYNLSNNETLYLKKRYPSRRNGIYKS